MSDQTRLPSLPPEDPRVRFAAERTLLAWMRTGLALMGLGFVVARFGLFLREIAAAGHVTVQGQTTGWSLVDRDWADRTGRGGEPVGLV